MCWRIYGCFFFSVKELGNYKQKLFLGPPQKIDGSTTKILKLLFFTINLYFVTSNQSIPRVFLLRLKSNDPQTFTSGSCKNPFLQCICYWYNLLWWIFWFHVISGRYYRLWKMNVTLRFFLSIVLLLSLKPSIFYALSPQYDANIKVPK